MSSSDQVAAFAAAWLSVLITHSLWSALVLLVPTVAMAPVIGSRADRAAGRRLDYQPQGR